MAIVLMLPLGLLAIAIAVLRLTLGSLHAHRAEQAAAVERSRPAERSGAAVAERLALTVDCPVCGDDQSGSSAEELVDTVHRHAWRAHGIPSPAHILESARKVTSGNDGDRVSLGTAALD